MRLLLTVLALALLSLLGSRLGFRSRRASLGIRLFVSAGSHYVLLGFLLGPRGAGLVSEGVTNSLAPIIALGLGWIGLLFGLQFDRQTLKAFTRREHAVVIGQSVVAWTILAAGLVGIFLLTGRDDPASLAAACAAAAAGCASSPTGVAIVFGSARVSGPFSRLATLATSLDGATGIVFLAIVYAAVHPPAPVGLVDLGPARWIVVPTLLALLFGWLFLSLSREKPPPDETMLFLLALALILAGTSLSIAASALFASWLTGAFIANLSPLRKRIFTALARWEKPVHVLFLLLAGALLSFNSWHVALFLAGYLILRAAGKLLGGRLAGPLLEPTPGYKRFGATLLSQGGVSIAVAMSALLVLRVRFPDSQVVPALFDATILGIMLFEIIGPVMMRRVLTSVGEIHEAAEPASKQREAAASTRSGSVPAEPPG